MNFGLLIGLTRARVALLAMGLAWLVGLVPDLGTRLAVAALIAIAVAADGWLDEQRIRHAPAKTRDRATH